jgi:hypothetical protein
MIISLIRPKMRHRTPENGPFSGIDPGISRECRLEVESENH